MAKHRVGGKKGGKKAHVRKAKGHKRHSKKAMIKA
jgi:hypothetical protein